MGVMVDIVFVCLGFCLVVALVLITIKHVNNCSLF